MLPPQTTYTYQVLLSLSTLNSWAKHIFGIMEYHAVPTPWPATKPDPARYGRKPDALAASHPDAPRLDRYHTSDPPQPAEFKDGEKKETSVYVNEFELGKFCWFITKCIET